VSHRLDDIVVTPDETPNERRLARSTARAFAAALSALLISTFVVSRSGSALGTDGTSAATTANSGTISLVDDDDGRSLFDLTDIAPGRPFEGCLSVTYDGTILPVDLTVAAEAQGDLAPFMATTIEVGKGGGFESCDGFEPEGVVYSGTLADLAATGATPVVTLRNTGETRSFRVTFEVADTNEALGLTTTAGFVWEVRPS
jgi:hypothetical protein